MYKKIVVLFVLVVSLLFTSGVMANETSFSDVSERYWAYEEIKNMSELGIVRGYRKEGDLVFKGNDEVSRAEAVVMIMRALDIEKGPQTEARGNGYDSKGDLTDVRGKWYEEEVDRALSKGIVKGYSDGTFRGEEEVNRAQVAALLHRAFDTEKSDENELIFTDVRSSHWAYGAIASMVSKGVVNGFSDGTFGIDRSATRTQFAVMMNRLLNGVEESTVDGNEGSEEGETIEVALNELDLADLMPGYDRSYVEELIGEPDRIEQLHFGYETYVYNEEIENLLFVSFVGDEVVDVYTSSKNMHYKNEEVSVGMGYEELKNYYSFEDYEQVTVELDEGTQNYVLSNVAEEKLESFIMRDDEVMVRFLLDIHDNTLAGVRVMSENAAVIAAENFYYWSIGGSGETLMDTFAGDGDVFKSNESIMFDLINASRVNKGLGELVWDEQVRDVAYGHSLDMYENDYFSHESPTYGSPADRMESAGLTVRGVGENLAYNQLDSIIANAALMNSRGHRANILGENYGSVGVGVSHKYYTQKFVIN